MQRNETEVDGTQNSTASPSPGFQQNDNNRNERGPRIYARAPHQKMARRVDGTESRLESRLDDGQWVPIGGGDHGSGS